MNTHEIVRIALNTGAQSLGEKLADVPTADLFTAADAAKEASEQIRVGSAQRIAYKAAGINLRAVANARSTDDASA